MLFTYFSCYCLTFTVVMCQSKASTGPGSVKPNTKSKNMFGNNFYF